jgi:hypothetical protein
MAEIANVENLENLSQITHTSPLRDAHNRINLSLFQSQATFQYTAPLTPEEGAGTEDEKEVDENAILDLELSAVLNAGNSLTVSTLTNQPNFDTTFAQQLFNQALLIYLTNVGELNHEPEMDFTEKTFIFLDPFIRHMSPFSRNSFFKHVKSLYDVMQDGVHSAMQRWLLQSLINKK